MLSRAIPLALVGVLAVSGQAVAQSSDDDLWATVNVCDTAKHPNEVGVRASMPGVPRGTGRRMRFRVQWRDGDRWRYVEDADSGWRRLPGARGRPVESGWNFEFAAPAREIRFRGVVRYRWLVGREVVRRAVETTEPGHRSTRGADPAGYSAATCSIG